jgi:hypothetical protein
MFLSVELEVTEEVRQFIGRYIGSLDQLEVLLLVSALPDREWSVDAVYQIVKSNPAIVTQRLEQFVAAGLLTASGTPPLYRYGPRTEDLSRQISSLGAIYKMSRHKIIDVIYSPKNDALKGFADAFRWKKDQ